MTFTEAAAQVLRLVGKPLHYKEITDVAIEKNLLSHVGKSPEVTMGARLAALVKKGDKDHPLVRLKPGVFALREWDEATIAAGLADRTPLLERIAANGGEHAGDAALPRSTASVPVAALLEASGGTPDRDDAELRRAEIIARGHEIFRPEEDDDEPIFGSDDDEDDEAPGSGDGDDASGGKGRKRRRRRRGRPSATGGLPSVQVGPAGGDDEGLPSYTISDAPVPAGGWPEARGPRPEPEGRSEPPRERGERGERNRGGRDRGRPEQPEAQRLERDRHERDRAERDRADRERAERSRAEHPETVREGREERPRGGKRAVMLDEVTGPELAEALEELISTLNRQGGVAPRHLADLARREGMLSRDLEQPEVFLAAAAWADNARREQAGLRPRFTLASQRIGLARSLLDPDLARAEREVEQKVERYREVFQRAFLKRLQELSPRALGELVVFLLERMDLASPRLVRIQGAAAHELHFVARSPGGPGGVGTAIVVRREGREIGRERVTELRGTLHHYPDARAGVIITTGQVLAGAREEAESPGAAPVRLIDGLELARLCERLGVGVRHVKAELPLPDLEQLAALR